MYFLIFVDMDAILCATMKCWGGSDFSLQILNLNNLYMYFLIFVDMDAIMCATRKCWSGSELSCKWTHDTRYWSTVRSSRRIRPAVTSQLAEKGRVHLPSTSTSTSCFTRTSLVAMRLTSFDNSANSIGMTHRCAPSFTPPSPYISLPCSSLSRYHPRHWI